jgi:hypothetical protein
MSVEKAIIEQWGKYFPLTSLVPLTRVWVGNIPERDDQGTAIDPQTSMPYISLVVNPKQKVTRTNSNIITNGVVKFLIFAQTRPEVKTIAQAISDHFNRISFPWSRGTMQDMRPGPESYEEDEEYASWLADMDCTFLLLEKK